VTKKACIVGAGISGISVANNLTRSDIEVVLIDRNPYPGGRAVHYGCKATDNCVHCGVCLVRDAIAQLEENSGVNIELSSTPRSMCYHADGSFEINVEFVDQEENRNTPLPPSRDDTPLTPLKGGFMKELPIKGRFEDKSPLEGGRGVSSLVADAVVLSTGFTPFNPSINRKWGYGNNPRVVTGSDLERLFYEETYLPDDTHKIAFIQCVGSRNIMEGMAQCSRICCAYALRMASRLKKEFPDTEIDFYYMDIQRFGKNFEQFWTTVSDKINFIRSNPITIDISEQGKPIIRFESIPGNKCEKTAYDLVVLSHGLCPSENADDLADMFDLNLDSDGFFKNSHLEGGKGGVRGVFIAGTCRGPMTIAECVEDASSVSGQVLKFLRNNVG